MIGLIMKRLMQRRPELKKSNEEDQANGSRKREVARTVCSINFSRNTRKSTL